jgi:autotransporter strand-loop-strand O-heptosyltransferase
MKEVLITEYNNLEQLNIPYKKEENKFYVSFIQGAKCEVIGDEERRYIVKFIDQKHNKVIHESEINNNMWTKTNIQYFINWKVEIIDKETNELVFEHKLDLIDKKVYIHFESSAIGDTLAWFPQVEEFRKKYKSKVVVSTFHNDWFKNQYPELEFVEPGTEVFNLYAMYCIGWFYNEDRTVNFSKSPIEFKKHPLGETASSMLGVSYKEIKAKVNVPDKVRQIDEKYVVIAPHASSHAKYWMYPKGWQTIIDYLNKNGYKVLMLTHELLGDEWHDSKLGGTLTGVINKTGNYPIEDRMVDIKHADAFIGVGSGLSWMSWSIGTPTILISGFSEPYTEFLDCERIFNYDTNVCTGCFNKHWLNPGNWEWCPEHENTPRQFECSKTIKPEQVIKSINKLLKIQ